MGRKISADLRETVRLRADFLCEYCHTNERWQYVSFTIDHVVPGGGDSPDNLALCRFHRNRRKSDKIEIVNPETSETVSIFNPRRHVWKEHFGWSEDGLRVVAKTAIGRASLVLLELNRAGVLFIRQADVAVRRHPPLEDLD